MKSRCLSVVTALLAVTAVAEPRIRLGGVIGERFETSVTGNVLKVDLAKDFFPPFAKRQEKGGFIGLGKHADALVHYARHTDDPRVAAQKRQVIDFILAHQDPDGYTGCYVPENRLGRVWDVHEMGFIIQGLLADYEFFGNRAALDAARRNVDYVVSRWDGLPERWATKEKLWDRLVTIGFGYGVARLYEATKDESHRTFLRERHGLDAWTGEIVLGRRMPVCGHAYSHLATCLEQLELYRHDPQPRYLEPSRRILDFMLKGDGLLVDGNGGTCECWTNDQDGEGHVGETCAAAYCLFFWDELLRLNVADRALLGDLMERNVYNALFGAMSRDGRRLRYYTPLNGARQFWEGDLYCCPNNFRRAMSRLPEYVFYEEKGGIRANLYTACTADLTAGGTSVRIVERTDYPRDGRVTFVLEPAEPADFAFTVRLPRWCRNPSVSVNGTAVNGAVPGQCLALTRTWKKGDAVALDLPMEPVAVRGRQRQAGRIAVLCGPVVYALDAGSVPALKDKHPLEAQTMVTLDAASLRRKGGYRIAATAFVYDTKTPVELIPFAAESANLTYLRAYDVKSAAIADDILFDE